MRPRRPLILTSALAVAAFSLLAAGCGGGGSPGIASVASSTGRSATVGLVPYAVCMRSHGVVDFPDPTAGGGISKPEVIRAFNEVSKSQGLAASAACEHLLPAGGSLSGQPSVTITPTDETDYLKAATCMRSHGFPGFPDPTFPNGGVSLTIPPTINEDSPAFKSAATTCTKLIPAGLPYSRSGTS